MRVSSILAIGFWAALVSATACAAQNDAEGPLFVDPAKVPEEYRFQGEYTGAAGPDEKRYGAQVIALGDGKFRLVGYPGGLPGEGWDREEEKIEIEGMLKEGELVFTGEKFTVRASDGQLHVFSEDGDPQGKLDRAQRKSPTLGKAAPEGAKVLFDGSSAEAFKDGQIVQGDLLAAGCESREKFGDHSLHVEFRTPLKPKARGQARGNSGVYVQGRYEIQVLDSFGLEGKDNECGGIYQIAAPQVNMCYPPLTWQTYDIDFTAARYDDQGNKTANARITVRHNGTVIHEDLELPHHTPGKYPEQPSDGPLYLQGHGNPVVYRNIWVVSR